MNAYCGSDSRGYLARAACPALSVPLRKPSSSGTTFRGQLEHRANHRPPFHPSVPSPSAGLSEFLGTSFRNLLAFVYLSRHKISNSLVPGL